MANTTLDTILNAVKFRVVRDDITDAEYVQRINWAMKDFCRLEIPELEKSGSFALSDSTTTYSLPSSLYTIISMRNASQDYALKPVTFEEWSEYDHNEEGEPEIYSRFGYSGDYPQVHLFPTPDSDIAGETIVYRYYAIPTEGSASSLSTSIDLTPIYDEAIVARSCYKIFRDTNEPERASIANNDWKEAMAAVAARRAGEFRYTTRVVQGGS